MLARPGWSGSGFNADPWWKHAVFFETGPPAPAGPDLKAVIAKLDALHTLGVDALILPALPLPAQSQQNSQRAAVPGASALDDFDELIHQAARRGIRVLLTLAPLTANADLTATARFWLSRGVSGFRLVAPPDATPQDAQSIAQSLRKITNSAVGARIVISDFNPAANSPAPYAQRGRAADSSYRRASRSIDSTAAQLQIDTQLDRLTSLDAANIRAAIAQSLLTPDLLLSFHPSPQTASSNPNPSLAKAKAAILLTTHSAALIDTDASAGASAANAATWPAPKSAADWYRQLSGMHHGNATLRFGSVSVLDFDAQDALVWVIRPPAITSLTPPIVVACNLSGSPLHLSLTAPLKALNLRGIFLRTLLRTDDAMGGQDLDYVNLPPYAVYIGELRR
jgi:alpha-glucosidase